MRIQVMTVIFLLLPGTMFSGAHVSQSHDIDDLLKTVERYESLVEQVLKIVQAKQKAQEKKEHNQNDETTS